MTFFVQSLQGQALTLRCLQIPFTKHFSSIGYVSTAQITGMFKFCIKSNKSYIFGFNFGNALEFEIIYFDGTLIQVG